MPDMGGMGGGMPGAGAAPGAGLTLRRLTNIITNIKACGISGTLGNI